MRRLKSRLDRLSAATGDDITRADERLLVSVLARRDSLFWPWRLTLATRPPMAEIRRRQRSYLTGAEGIAAKADGRSAWKDAHAARQRLIAAGLVTATHSSGQVQSMFLTARGEALARSLVGDRLHTIEAARPILTYLRIASAQTAVRAVRESVLFNRECVGNPEDWSEFTEWVLPLLTSGLVEATCDAQGRACYIPVDNIAVPEAAEIATPTQADPDFDDCYVSAFNAERHVLQNAEPSDPSEIFLPLPATGWGWPCHFKEGTADEKR